jgi:DNA-binding response OmpR family regulator
MMVSKALIIDGNANFLYGLETKFVVSGIDVLTYDGTGYVEDIMQLLRQEKINFIISDLELPNFNGLEALEKIKAEPTFSQIPYFIYTFINDEKVKIKSLNLGANYYFLKEEIGLDEFSLKVKKILFNQEKIKRFNI